MLSQKDGLVRVKNELGAGGSLSNTHEGSGPDDSRHRPKTGPNDSIAPS